eukprot:scaffold304383_cov21-Tisochrysis_lutea.AAC.1
MGFYRKEDRFHIIGRASPHAQPSGRANKLKPCMELIGDHLLPFPLATWTQPECAPYLSRCCPSGQVVTPFYLPHRGRPCCHLHQCF